MKLLDRGKEFVEAPKQAMGIALIALFLAGFALIYTVVKTHGA